MNRLNCQPALFERAASALDVGDEEKQFVWRLAARVDVERHAHPRTPQAEQHVASLEDRPPRPLLCFHQTKNVFIEVYRACEISDNEHNTCQGAKPQLHAVSTFTVRLTRGRCSQYGAQSEFVQCIIDREGLTQCRLGRGMACVLIDSTVTLLSEMASARVYWLGMVACGHEIYLPFSNTQGGPRPEYDSARRSVARVRGIAAPADLAKFADFV